MQYNFFFVQQIICADYKSSILITMMNIETPKLSKIERLINNMCCHKPEATDEEVTRVYYKCHQNPCAGDFRSGKDNDCSVTALQTRSGEH